MNKKKTQTVDILDKPQDEKHKNLVKYCVDFYNTHKKSEYREAKLKEIKDARRIYEQKPKTKVVFWKGESNLELPFETISIDNLEPRLMAGLVGREPIVAFAETGKLDKEGEVLETWYNEELKNVVKINEVARNIVHTLLIEGTRYSFDQYDKRESPKRDFVFVNPQTNEPVKKDEIGIISINPDNNQPFYTETIDTIFEGGKDEQIPFNDIVVADDIGTIEKWEDADKIRIVNIPYGELYSKKGDYGYQNIGPWLLPAETQKKLKEEDKSPSQQVAGVDVTGKDTIKCIECHISYAIGNLEEEDEKKRAEFEEERVIVTIALEQNLLIRKILQRDVNMNNESVLKRQRLFPEEGRSYGTGIHGKMKAIQEGASNTFNRMMNIADIVLLPWYFYEEGAGIKGKQTIKPAEGLKVEDVSKIKFPDFKVNPAQYIEFLKIFVDLWERTISISEPQIGKPKGERTTATEITVLLQEGNIKHNYQSKTFREEFLSIVRTIYDLYYQYMPYEKMIVHAGEEMPFPRQAMRRPYNFRLTGSTEQSNKLIERKENEDMFNMLRPDPLMNPIKIIEDLLKSYGREDVKSYINPELHQLTQIFEMAPDAVMEALAPVVQMIQEQEGGKGGQTGTNTQ